MRAKKQKPVKAWGIAEPGHDMPLLFSLRDNRRVCTDTWTHDCQAPHREPPYTPTWDDLKREGYRCVRVLITIVEG